VSLQQSGRWKSKEASSFWPFAFASLPLLLWPYSSGDRLPGVLARRIGFVAAFVAVFGSAGVAAQQP